MRSKLLFWLFVLSILGPGVAHGSDARNDGPISFLPGCENGSIMAQRPVFGLDGQEVAEFKVWVNKGEYFEAVYGRSSDRGVPLLAGKGKFLWDSLAKSKASAKQMIDARLGSAGKTGDPVLIRGGPLHYWARIEYSQNERKLGDLIIDLTNQKVVVKDLFSEGLPSDQKPWKSGPFTGKQMSEGSEILTSVPIYPLFLSDRATCLAMVLGYWAANGYPELKSIQASGAKKGIYAGEHFYREWMREIDLIGKGCPECQSIEKIIELFSIPRECPMGVRSFDGKDLSNGNRLIDLIREMVHEKQPFLLEDLALEPGRFAVGVGYLISGGWPFVACLVPRHEEVVSAWNPVFINWGADFEDLRIYQIIPLNPRSN